MKTLLVLLLMSGMVGLAQTKKQQTMCVGFTGPQCDGSYPMDQCGLQAAIDDYPGGPTLVLVGAGRIWVDGFCSERDERDFYKHGENFLVKGVPRMYVHPWGQIHIRDGISLLGGTRGETIILRSPIEIVQSRISNVTISLD